MFLSFAIFESVDLGRTRFEDAKEYHDGFKTGTRLFSTVQKRSAGRFPVAELQVLAGRKHNGRMPTAVPQLPYPEAMRLSGFLSRKSHLG
jgi:hypothetical protein